MLVRQVTSQGPVNGPFVAMIPVFWEKRDRGSLCVMEVIGLPHIVDMREESGHTPHALRLGTIGSK